MAVVRVNLEFYQGSVCAYIFNFTDSITQLPINMFGWDAKLVIKLKRGQNEPILDSFGLVEPDDSLLLDGPAGKITLRIPGIRTAGYNFRTAVYELQATPPFEIGEDNVVTGTFSGQQEIAP